MAMKKMVSYGYDRVWLDYRHHAFPAQYGLNRTYEKRQMVALVDQTSSREADPSP